MGDGEKGEEGGVKWGVSWGDQRVFPSFLFSPFISLLFYIFFLFSFLIPFPFFLVFLLLSLFFLFFPSSFTHFPLPSFYFLPLPFSTLIPPFLHVPFKLWHFTPCFHPYPLRTPIFPPHSSKGKTIKVRRNCPLCHPYHNTP